VAASGKDLITAVILGYEVSLRIGRAIRSVATEEGRKTVLYSSSFPIFGSATSAGRLFGLNKEGMNSAFGIAGTVAPAASRGSHRGGVAARLGEAKLNYHTQAFLGTFAAWQAHKGLMGPKDILDGDIFWTRSGANSCNYPELTRDLGEKYRIMEVGFKLASACRYTHPAITAVWKALEGETVKAEDIEEILLTQVMLLTPAYEWDTMVQAQFSLPCAVAMSIAGGEPGPGWYKASRFKDPDIRELAHKVKFIEDPEATELWLKYGKLVGTAEVKTRDGKIRKAHIEHPKGEPENPFTEEEFQRKFMTNAVGILGQKQAEELKHKLLHLEEAPDVSALRHLLYSRD
jgi:2-methylcitrate dehydratase PrpD